MWDVGCLNSTCKIRCELFAKSLQGLQIGEFRKSLAGVRSLKYQTSRIRTSCWVSYLEEVGSSGSGTTTGITITPRVVYL